MRDGERRGEREEEGRKEGGSDVVQPCVLLVKKPKAEWRTLLWLMSNPEVIPTRDPEFFQFSLQILTGSELQESWKSL